MRSQDIFRRVEPVALAFALASPLPMLALAPDGWVVLAIVVLGGLVPVAVGWAILRAIRRGRPAVRRPPLVPPALGPPTAAIRGAPFQVRRRGRVVVAGIYDDVVAAARAGRLDAFDEVVGGGVTVSPADLSDLVGDVPSRWEARARRVYLGYLAVTVAAGAAGIAVLAVARASGREGASTLAVLAFAAALVPLPFLRREWRRCADGRARGLVPEPLPAARMTLGSAPLDAVVLGPAPATRAVLVVVVGVSIAAMLLPPDVLTLRLAKDNDAIREGEVWRLLTAGLVHGGAFHLLMNAMVLSDIGKVVERLLGAGRMLAVLWGGVLAGSLASFAANPQLSVGISGGIFALVGALLAVGLRHRRSLAPPARRMLVRAPIEVILLNVALGLALPVIDNAAHLGGLAGGVLLGAVLGVRPEVRAALRTGPDSSIP